MLWKNNGDVVQAMSDILPACVTEDLEEIQAILHIQAFIRGAKERLSIDCVEN